VINPSHAVRKLTAAHPTCNAPDMSLSFVAIARRGGGKIAS
jgi:hypothetical protein